MEAMKAAPCISRCSLRCAGYGFDRVGSKKIPALLTALLPITSWLLVLLAGLLSTTALLAAFSIRGASGTGSRSNALTQHQGTLWAAFSHERMGELLSAVSTRSPRACGAGNEPID